ncbi:MAG: hypothetical protein SGILL_005816 [Bacillariaceae sp.]
MASIVWMSIFLILAIELIITLILVLPVPRKTRNFIAKGIFQFHIAERLKMPIRFIGVALSLALIDSYSTHQRIMTRVLEEQEAGMLPSHHTAAHHDHFYPGLHDRERKYKSERNMYLAGFALTLLFVIGRLAVLLEETVELHEEIDRVSEQQPKKNEGDMSGTTANYSKEALQQLPTKSKQEKKSD